MQTERVKKECSNINSNSSIGWRSFCTIFLTVHFDLPLCFVSSVALQAKDQDLTFHLTKYLEILKKEQAH